MSLMSKLLATTLLLSSFVYANTNVDSKKIEGFLSEQFLENQNIKTIDVKVENRVPIKELKGWDGYIVNVEATLKKHPKNIIKQKMIWFSNGKMITKDLTDLNSGENLTDLIKPNFKSEYYKKENLIFGNVNAKHKIAIFSDPLCPFCRSFVPGALADMKKQPKKFAVYYYHFPLPRLHPASVEIVKAAVAAEQKGYKDVIEKLYHIKINPQEKNIDKILVAFNKAVGSDIKPEDLKKPAVLKEIKFDFDVANDVMVGGTPTVYLDGKIDKAKNTYKKLKN